ncbi:hypothetical protein BpHYR1_008124 [Brachionus plicatilis]|uniref:Uncharacterized protein n=1 Tax=Brachionus plicatilis TaxID=10195 RepID=A0A3M7R222_BRAPC|nr:hypothetical protein BpHYR1_008124 [Brachionus plicatilis]
MADRGSNKKYKLFLVQNSPNFELVDRCCFRKRQSCIYPILKLKFPFTRTRYKNSEKIQFFYHFLPKYRSTGFQHNFSFWRYRIYHKTLLSILNYGEESSN